MVVLLSTRRASLFLLVGTAMRAYCDAFLLGKPVLVVLHHDRLEKAVALRVDTHAVPEGALERGSLVATAAASKLQALAVSTSSEH
jgi:hypothetical protein